MTLDLSSLSLNFDEVTVGHAKRRNVSSDTSQKPPEVN